MNKFRVALSIIVLILSCCSLAIYFCIYSLWEQLAIIMHMPSLCVEYGFILPFGVSMELLCGFVLSVTLFITTIKNNRNIILEIVITTLFIIIIPIVSKCISYIQINNYDSVIALATYSHSEALFEFPKKIYTFYVPIAIMLCGMNVAKKRLDKQDIEL